MPTLSFAGHIKAGDALFDFGVSSLAVAHVGGMTYLLAASGQDGGIASFSLNSALGLPEVSHTFTLTATVATGTGRPITLAEQGGELLVLTGQHQGPNAEVVSLATNGALATADALEGLGSAPLNWLAQTGSSLVSAELGSSTLQISGWGGGNTAVATLSDTGASHLAGLSALATATLAGTSYLVTGSAAEAGVSLFTLSGTTATLHASISAASGLGLMVPTDIKLVEIGGSGFVLVASAPSHGSGGAVSVMSLEASGALTPVDHILDTQETRFGSITALETIEANGHIFVAAAGGDGGVSLFQLAPNGQLVHLTSLEGTAAAPLLGVTDLALHLSGETLQVFVSTQAGEGVTMLTANLGALGGPQLGSAANNTLTGTNAADILAGGAGNDLLRGNAGDDILLGGAGSDTLIGGDGHDIFVISAGGTADRIEDFDPAKDRIDLSSWPFLYDTTAVDIAISGRNATLTWRGEVLQINGTEALSLPMVQAALVIDTNRSFTMPAQELTGSATADALTGDWGTDTLLGGDGDDTLTGGRGDDRINGGTGTDTAIINDSFANASFELDVAGTLQITSADGTDTFENVEYFIFNDTALPFESIGANIVLETYGSAGSERVEGGAYTDMIFGQAGDDTLFGNAENDTLDGGAGHDSLEGGAGDDSLLGGTGDDTLRGGQGSDALQGDAGDDLLFGDEGDDTLHGNDGNDTLSATRGDNVLSGGEGNDSLTGGEGQDTLTGGTGRDTLRGGGGADSLSGDAGTDWLYGQDGNDTLHGHEDNDTLYGDAGDDSLTGGTGDDRLYGGEGDDTLDGGAGNDLLFDTSGQNILAGDEGDDSLVSGSFEDTLLGGAGRDTLKAGSGNDSLNGGADNDWLDGAGGDDTLLGGEGNDTLWGKGGNDTLWGEAGSDQLYGNAGDDILRGGAGHDTLRGGKSDDTLFGEDDNDIIKGQKGDDFVSAGAGNDVARGNKGSDTVFGEAGDDLLVGGGGADTLHGGTGEDTVKGGGGDDVFVFQKGDGKDVFRSFGKGNDSLLIDASLWGSATTARDLIRDYGTVTNRGVIFDFGEDDRIILAGYHDLWGLADDIFMG